MRQSILLGTLLAFSLLISNCEDDDAGTNTDYTSLFIVTGLDFLDENGQPIGRWGFPNHNPGAFAAFPNPSIGAISLFAQEDLLQVWLIPATCAADSVTMNITTLAAELEYSQNELDDAQIASQSFPAGTRQINLNFEDVPGGFYRLFYESTSGVFWQNIYIDPNASSFPNYFQLIDGLCQ